MYEAYLGIVCKGLYLKRNGKTNENIVKMNTDKLSTSTYRAKEDVGMSEYLKLEYRR
ncbi:hypothetical protein PV797_04515 [Clostridiaceae bacterium M8S5]|nr:hypothetical protein PV797_04515 [Clostridiaceae bacterium M8S5]